MKKIKWITLLCFVVILTGCSGEAKETSAKDAETQEVVEEAGIDVFGEAVTVIAREIVIDFPAKVTKIHVKEGQKVRKGELIVTLDFNEYEMDILKKQNEIALYEEQLNQLQRNINPLGNEVNRLKKELGIKQGYITQDTDPDIKTLERSIERLDEVIETVKKEYEVAQEIYDIGSSSAKELEDAKQNLANKEKEKKDLQANIDKIKTSRELEVAGLNAALKNNQAQLSNTDIQNETKILELESKLETAQIDLKMMQNKLDKSYIKEKAIVADSDDIIIYDITCNEGSIIGKGEGAIMRIMDEKTLFISVDIPEEYINQVAIGSRASIVPYADKAEAIKGKVIRLSDRAIKQNGETIIKADIELEEAKGILKPGLTVDVRIYE